MKQHLQFVFRQLLSAGAESDLLCVVALFVGRQLIAYGSDASGLSSNGLQGCGEFCFAGPQRQRCVSLVPNCAVRVFALVRLLLRAGAQAA
jgi:hypothetical protein